MDVFRGLLHDAPSSADAAVAAHRSARARPDGWAVGPLVVGDARLADLPGDLALSVVLAGGAGGITALARRTGTLEVVSVEAVLRDLDDLAGNAARVVAAADSLTDGTDVFVGLAEGAGLVGAVEVVEAAGLLGRVDVAGATEPGGGRADLLSLLVEADLPFKVTGLGAEAFGAYGVVALLVAVEALVDGADAGDAEQLLLSTDAARSLTALRGWSPATQARVARRLRGVDCSDVAASLDQLTAAGVLTAA